MTLQQLRYFVSLGQHLHFGEAAKACFVSQPSLSQSITELETELNLKLLDRSSRRVEFTRAGKAFYTDSQEIIKSLDEAITHAKRIDSGLDGDFRIGTLGGLSNGEFLTNVASFKKKNKTLNISLVQTNMKTIIISLLRGSLDIALTRDFDIIHHDQELDWFTLYQNRYGIIMRKDHPLAIKEDIQLLELKDEPFIFIDKEVSPNAYSFTLRLCASQGLDPRIIHTASTLESVCAMVQAGMGISIQPDCSLIYNTGNLRFIQIDSNEAYSSVVLAWHHRNISPIIPLFLEEFESNMEQHSGFVEK